ncbi:hypothetical protein DLE03_01890 [Actinobacteria bacterium IMCC25003]|nr:hypothetical protein DLE03_01890 [Actinobacteria bacterium IMCC25003]
MKRIAIFLALLLLGISQAVAAPKSVAVKKLSLIPVNQGAEKLVITGKTLVTIGNTDGVNSNILLTGLDATGTQLWQKTIDSGVDEVALAATTDPSGNIWLAGASSAIEASESATAQIQVENPDGVLVEPASKLRGDMNLLTFWKVSSAGDLVATYTAVQSAPALINAISANASGVSVVGSLQDKPFIQSITSQGVFGKIIPIGTSKSSLNAIVRQSDGTLSVFGTSAETLGGKKLAGIRDGILIKISKTGAVASVVRSSAPKADRSWIGADPSLALTGFVKTGKVIESAFTKFTSAFTPSWTLRVPSLGTSAVISAGTTTYGAFASNSAVSGVIGWKPTSPSLLLISFDSKGVITGAFGSNEITEPIALAYAKEFGFIGLAKTPSQSLSLFKLP